MAFLNLPPLPATTTAELRAQIETYRVGFSSEDEETYKAAYSIAETLVAFKPDTVDDFAAKLMVAVHQLAPGDAHETLFSINPTDMNSVCGEELIIGCVNDAIRLAAVLEWERSLSEYRTAHTTYLRALDLVSCLEEQSVYDGPTHDALDAHSDWAMKAEVVAEKRLLATPAPDMAAVRIKMEVLESISPLNQTMQAIVADLVRIEVAEQIRREATAA